MFLDFLKGVGVGVGVGCGVVDIDRRKGYLDKKEVLVKGFLDLDKCARLEVKIKKPNESKNLDL